MKAAPILALGLLFSPSTTEYWPMETLELVLRADAIADGVVTTTQALAYPTFTIDVQELIHGSMASREMTVRCFVDWPCAARYAPYAKGQRAIFFLQYQRGDKGQALVDQPYRVMGTGNDGECPVVDGTLLHNDYMLQGLPTARLNAAGHEYAGLAIPRDQYVSAVNGLRNCFSWPSEVLGKALPESERQLRQLCSDADLSTFMRSSPFAEAIVRDSNAYERLVEKKQ